MKVKTKRTIKVFAVLSVLIVVFVMWKSVSWVFNYRVVSSVLDENSNDKTSQEVAINSIQNNTSATPAATAIQPAQDTSQVAGDFIQVPAINLESSIVTSDSTDVNFLEKKLDEGAVIYPGSVMPGQNGETLLLGHSAPANWPHIKHDWVFSNIENLKKGDSINISFQGKVYTYRVVGHKIINIGQDVDIYLNKEYNNKNTLLLVSCWPPGKNYKRIVVQAELQL